MYCPCAIEVLVEQIVTALVGFDALESPSLLFGVLESPSLLFGVLESPALLFGVLGSAIVAIWRFGKRHRYYLALSASADFWFASLSLEVRGIVSKMPAGRTSPFSFKPQLKSCPSSEIAGTCTI